MTQNLISRCLTLTACFAFSLTLMTSSADAQSGSRGGAILSGGGSETSQVIQSVPQSVVGSGTTQVIPQSSVGSGTTQSLPTVSAGSGTTQSFGSSVISSPVVSSSPEVSSGVVSSGGCCGSSAPTTVYSAPAPVYSAPVYSAPVYSAPVRQGWFPRRFGSCCCGN